MIQIHHAFVAIYVRVTYAYVNVCVYIWLCFGKRERESIILEERKRAIESLEKESIEDKEME